jgi:exonuclease III
MSEQHCRVLNWNVRGLNATARRSIVHDLAKDTRCTIACLQETKLTVIDSNMVTQVLG